MSSRDQLSGNNNNSDQSEIGEHKQINEKQEKPIQEIEADMSSRDQLQGNNNNPDQREIELKQINEKQEKPIQEIEADMSSRDQLQGNNNNPDQSEIELKQINERQEKRIQALEAKALQLTNLYFVFQGVILSTCASARTIKCHHWWIPFVLSLLAAILNLFALYFTVKKILSCRDHFDQNLVHIDSLRSKREEKRGEPRRNRSDQCKKRWRWVLAYASIGLALGFSGVVLYGCHALLC